MSLERLVGIFGLLFIAAIALRTYLVYRRSGQMPITVNSGDAAHDYIHKTLIAIVALYAINILTFRLQALYDHAGAGPAPDLYAYLQPFLFMETKLIRAAGVALCYCGLVWFAVAQRQMGQSWRIGIDSAEKPALVTHGLFKLSRNPIYLGLIIVAFGLLLATPNAVTLVCAVLAVVILSIQTRLEEAHMLSLHGDAYRDYLKQTRRWI